MQISRPLCLIDSRSYSLYAWVALISDFCVGRKLCVEESVALATWCWECLWNQENDPLVHICGDLDIYPYLSLNKGIRPLRLTQDMGVKKRPIQSRFDWGQPLQVCTAERGMSSS